MKPRGLSGGGSPPVPLSEVKMTNKGYNEKNWKNELDYLVSCEWNPVEDRLARDSDKHHGKALWSVDRDMWIICGKCAKLPIFEDFPKERI